MIDLASARELVLGAFDAASAPIERVALAHAQGRVLASPVVAPRDIPGFAHAAMDGFAVRAADLATAGVAQLDVVGRRFAGDPPGSPVASGTCVRIMTGAALPPGADAVVMRENADDAGECVRLGGPVARGTNVRAADDDWSAGAAAFPAGRVLDAVDLAVLASFGLESIEVRARPRIGVLVTGDELVPPGQALRPGQRHDSNSILLAGLLVAHACAPGTVATSGDDRARLDATLSALCATHPLVITTGGASAGDSDWMPALLAERGERLFWKVALRPGMPVAFGRIGDCRVFVLPGNPVSVLATFIALVRPALARWLGAPALDPPPVTARLAAAIDKKHARREFRRALAWFDGDGVLHAAPHEAISSGALRGAAQSAALLELAEPPSRLEAGTRMALHWLRAPGAGA
jgi:molybdopterin molybdotransferase